MKDLIAFKHLSPAEQGVILLAIHNGEAVESSENEGRNWGDLVMLPKERHLSTTCIVRIKPIARVIYIDMRTQGIYSTQHSDSNRIKFIEVIDADTSKGE